MYFKDKSFGIDFIFIGVFGIISGIGVGFFGGVGGYYGKGVVVVGVGVGVIGGVGVVVGFVGRDGIFYIFGIIIIIG